MAGLRIPGKTVDAIQLLRQPKVDLPKEVRTLLLLVDGKHHFKELRNLAKANGVAAFDEAFAYLEQAKLVHDLPAADEDSIALDDVTASAPPAHLITLDLTLPVGGLPEPPPAARRGPAAAPAAGPAVCVRDPGTEDPRSEIRAKLTELMRPEVEAQLREQLRPEVRASLQKELTAKLEGVLRPAIERHLTARIRNELKPRIEQEFRARLEKALATRMKAEDMHPAPAGCDPSALVEEPTPIVLELEDHR